jgi:surfactin synthase thioesterase subunit
MSLGEKTRRPHTPEDPSDGGQTNPSAFAQASEGPGVRALRLFCFPYAGAGTPVFGRWQEGLPDSIVVHPIELPGRGGQFTAAPATRMDTLVGVLAEQMQAYLTEPFAFFGHSMGALVAFELARAIRQRAGVEPVAMYVASQPAPQLQHAERELHNLPDAELTAELRRIGGTPQEVLANDEFMALLLPTVRADLEVCETYAYSEDRPLSCPIIAYGGAEDPDVSTEDLKAWADHTTGAFAFATLPGGHFFIDQNRREVLAALSASLARWR